MKQLNLVGPLASEWDSPDFTPYAIGSIWVESRVVRFESSNSVIRREMERRVTTLLNRGGVPLAKEITERSGDFVGSHTTIAKLLQPNSRRFLEALCDCPIWYDDICGYRVSSLMCEFTDRRRTA